MQDWDKIKIVGKRKPPVVDIFSPEWDAYLDLIWSLRQDKTFIPRGVYKFKTFEEANEWWERMRVGGKPDRRNNYLKLINPWRYFSYSFLASSIVIRSIAHFKPKNILLRSSSLAPASLKARMR